MAGKVDKVAGALRAGGAKAKTVGAKAYRLATDPVVQEKTKKLLGNATTAYRAANSPEAKEAYRQAADILRKALKK